MLSDILNLILDFSSPLDYNKHNLDTNGSTRKHSLVENKYITDFNNYLSVVEPESPWSQHLSQAQINISNISFLLFTPMLPNLILFTMVSSF